MVLYRQGLSIHDWFASSFVAVGRPAGWAAFSRWALFALLAAFLVIFGFAGVCIMAASQHLFGSRNAWSHWAMAKYSCAAKFGHRTAFISAFSGRKSVEGNGFWLTFHRAGQFGKPVLVLSIRDSKGVATTWTDFGLSGVFAIKSNQHGLFYRINGSWISKSDVITVLNYPLRVRYLGNVYELTETDGWSKIR